ncbi:MAG: helix-turn-helix domain-containing protein [bacterium]
MSKRRKEATMKFGTRLAELRKAAGYTQVAFAQETGISQRMVAYYESPEAHPPAHLLADMARVLGVTTDELLGLAPVKRAKKVGSGRLERRLQQIERLEPTEKRQILQVLDTLLESAQLKRKAQAKQPA